MKYTARILIILSCFLLCLPFARAQQTRIIGEVTDSVTGEPLPFVNVIIKGTTIGVLSGFDGKFSLETKAKVDSLVASFIGYRIQKKKIQQGKFQTINFSLVPTTMQLAEVVIKPGENPAEVILRKIIKNKENNDREKLDAYQYEAYTKIQFDANNITDKFKKQRIFKPFQFIFENLDTSTVNGKAYLPIFLAETMSDVYFRRTPKTEREIIKANKVSGIKNESMSQFLGDLIQSVNIYDNYANIFQKNFVSPIASFGLGYYKYYLVDSTFIGNQWCYKIMFKPRRKQELTFTGNIWVHDSTWAIRSVDMKIVEDANINFIKDLVVKQDYELIDNKYWMLTKDQLVADFNILEESRSTLGFYGHKTTTYRKFVINQPKPDDFYNVPTNIVIEEKALDRSEEYWKQARHDSLTRDEKTIYHMIDTLQSLPAFRTYVDIIRMITVGYYVKGYMEWGPYMSLISFNKQEGTRFSFGGRTADKFSTKILLEGHLAYGIKDRTFKGSGGFLYLINKNLRRAIDFSYKDDLEQLGQSQNAFRTDYLLGSIFRRGLADKLSMVQEYKTSYEHEWFNGFSNTIRFNHRKILSVGNTKFIVYSPETQTLSEKTSITTSEIQIDTRLAYKEKFVMGTFYRSSLGAKFPVLNIQYSYGIPGFLKSDYEYHRLQASLEHWFNIGTFGWSKYIIEAGRIWGKVPFPLLKLHEGNETYNFDEYAFNTMNAYEFVSDRYLSAFYTHHFEGLFFNHIPLFRKLKWREVGYVKGLVGSIDQQQKSFAQFPSGLGSLSKPYFEAGMGVENIFRILRIDAIWRLSYLDNPNITKFGIRFSLWFDF